MAEREVSNQGRKATEILPESITRLRCGLGMSRADFGRTLGVTWNLVLDWETGAAVPDQDERMKLIRLSQQSEAHAEQTVRRPLIEAELKSRGLGQMHDSDFNPPEPTSN